MLHLACANIKFRIVRSIISVFAISVGISLLLILMGLTQGTIDELINRIKQVGADIVAQPADGNFFLGLKSAVIPAHYGKQIEAIEGVKTVVPIVTWIAKMNRQMHVVYGLDTSKFSALSNGKFALLEGKEFSSLEKVIYEIMMDDRLAAAYKLKVGDTIRLFNKQFNIVGIYKEGIGARLIMPIKTLQDKLDQGNKVSFFYIKCDSSANLNRIKTVIEEKLPALRVSVSSQLEDMVKKTLSGLNDFVGAVSVVALFISALIVLLTMYTTVLERTREIGILKALGATNFFIASTVVLEAIILSLFGVGMGGGLFLVAKYGIIKMYPLLTIQLSREWFLIATGIGVCVGIVGALFPAYLASRNDPVKALRYE